MTIKLSESLDSNTAAKAFGKDGFVEIRDSLIPEGVDKFRNMANYQPEWMITLRENGAAITISAQARASMTDRRWRDKQGRAYELTRREHQYHHWISPLLGMAGNNGQTVNPLAGFGDAMRTPEFAQMISQVAGETDLKLQTCEALCLGFNHFRARLRYDETGPSETTYVFLDLTPGWSPNWGGILQFYDREGDIKRGLLPRFNSLIVIRNDQDFGISLLPSYVDQRRYLVMAGFGKG